MKLVSCFVLLAALGIGTSAMASAVAPSVTGTVTGVSPRGTDTQVMMNGHTYTITTHTRSAGAAGALQPGQKVTFFLSSDGHTVLMTQADAPHATHP